MYDVLRSPDNQESRVMPTVVTWRKRLSENNGNLVLSDMIAVVRDFVNAGLFAFLARLILLGFVKGHHRSLSL